MSTALAPMGTTATTVSSTAARPSPPTLSDSSSSLPQLNLTPRKIAGISRSTSNPATPGTPGRWQHPRMDEVIRRWNATNFDSSNVRAILLNGALILCTLFLPRLLHRIVPFQWLHSVQPFSTYALLGIHMLLMVNIGFAVAPLFRKPDLCEDVPLTPSQRQLLGLPPMSRPATPQEQEQYVTPPRFARSGTPRSSTGSLYAEPSDSPLSGRSSSPTWGRGGVSSAPGSGQNDRTHSPLFISARAGGEHRKRLSYSSNRSSPLSISDFDASGSISTPTKGTKATVGLNNKWLYEKGRGSPFAKMSPFS